MQAILKSRFPPLAPQRSERAMDLQSLGRLRCSAKAPGGALLDAIVAHYKADLRAFAGSTQLRDAIVPVLPTARCKKPVGRGRCRAPASDLAVVQLCKRHRCTEVNDSNIIGLRMFRQMVKGVPAWENVMGHGWPGRAQGM